MACTVLCCGVASVLFVVIAVLVFVLQKIGYFYVLLHGADRESERHGGELVAETLHKHGVKFMFTLAGGHISPILVASEKLGIRVVDTRHEATAVFAADAVARLSGTVGVVAVTAGPGLTNTVTAVKNAQMAESPVLLIGGSAATLLKGRGALQDIDQMSLFKPLCKFCATINHLRDIKPVLTKALHAAQSDTPGPVFVEFPIDTLYPYKLVAQEVGLSSGRGLFQKALNWYLHTHMDNVFAGAWDPLPVVPIPVSIPLASSSEIQKCVELISRSKKPVILIGSQSTLPPTPVDSLASELKNIGIPCFLGGMARGMLGKNSPIQFRQCRKDALKEADLVVLAGIVCDFRLSYGRVLSRKSKIISINRNKEQLYKNSGFFWNPTLASQSDVGSTLLSIARGLKGFKCDPEWIKMLREKDNAKEKANSVMGDQQTDVHLNPVKILHKLEEILPDDSIIVADGGDFVGTAAYILRPRGPLRWLDPGAFGTLGVGGGFALGAKLCRPDSELWIVYGDGSFGYSAAEFDTYTRHKTPVIALIGNDACWSQIARDQVRILGRGTACDLAYCSYNTVAEGFGGRGYLLDRTNEDEMETVLRAAQKDTAEGHSVVLNCLIGKTKFREGSISV